MMIRDEHSLLELVMSSRELIGITQHYQKLGICIIEIKFISSYKCSKSYRTEPNLICNSQNLNLRPKFESELTSVIKT
jgi:hypothetical protein